MNVDDMVVIAKDVFDYDSLSRRRRVGRLHDIWAGDRRLKVAGMVQGSLLSLWRRRGVRRRNCLLCGKRFFRLNYLGILQKTRQLDTIL